MRHNARMTAPGPYARDADALALLVDFDGVLRRWPAHDRAIESAHRLPAGAIRDTAFEPSLLHRAITGAIADEAWRQEIAVRLSARYRDSDATEAVAQWSRAAGSVDAVVHAMLACCRDRLRVVLVTNATTRLPNDLAALGLEDFFHAIANSSALGAAKPDAAIFEAALSMAGVAPANALYVDDSAHNVAAAQAMGMRTCLFRGHDSLRSFLDRHDPGRRPMQ